MRGYIVVIDSSRLENRMELIWDSSTVTSTSRALLFKVSVEVYMPGIYFFSSADAFLLEGENIKRSKKANIMASTAKIAV